MAPRKTTKNPSQAISDAIDTKPENNLYDLAVGMGITLGELRERLSAKLDNSDPLDWETVPAEHEPLLKIIANEVEAGKTRQLHSVEAQETVVEPEIPVLEEEPKAVAAKSKRKSSALTKKKTDAIAKGREASQQTKEGVKQTLARIQAQAGINDAANAGTTYLQAYQATLNQVKGQGLTVIAAEMIRDLNTDSDFNPDAILQDLGIAISADTQQALMEQLAPMLGKSKEATQEVLETSWGNGIDLQAELLQLDSLMNFED